MTRFLTTLLGAGALLAEGTSALAAPSLDDLLNLPTQPAPGRAPEGKDEPDKSAPPPPGMPGDGPAINLEDVKKLLTQKEVADLYKSAIQDMQTAAERLSDKRDAGSDTQNAQQEAIDKLARLITDLERRQQSGSSGKSKSKSESSDEGDQPQQQSDQGSQQNSGKPGNSSKSGGKPQPGSDGKDGKDGEKSGAKKNDGKDSKDGKKEPGKISGGLGDPGDTTPRSGDNPGGTPTTPLEEAKSNWGNLPPRVRDELLEGITEKFSPIYREMTESYYKRLAEDKK